MNGFSFTKSMRWAGRLFSLAAALLLVSCGKNESDDVVLPKDPKQAASQLDEAFVSAPAQIKSSVAGASEAMRTGDFEKAVVHLQAVRGTEALTLNQGLAVHGSIVALEAELIQAAEAGNANAARAYQLLKAMKRN